MRIVSDALHFQSISHAMKAKVIFSHSARLLATADDEFFVLEISHEFTDHHEAYQWNEIMFQSQSPLLSKRKSIVIDRNVRNSLKVT